MGILELAFVVCSTTSPIHCEEKSLLFTDEISVFACTMGAMPQLAKWIEEHPKWQIKKWKCRSFKSEKSA